MRPTEDRCLGVSASHSLARSQILTAVPHALVMQTLQCDSSTIMFTALPMPNVHGQWCVNQPALMYNVICTIGSYVCTCCFLLDFKRLLACTLNLIIGHLVPQNAEIGGTCQKIFRRVPSNLIWWLRP